MYPGINRAIYASGKIKSYQITVAIFLISILPIGYLLLNLDFNVEWVLVLMFLMQIFTLIATIYYAKKECGLNIKDFYVNSVIKPGLLFLLVYFTMRGSIVILSQNDETTLLNLLLYSLLFALVYISLFLLLVLSKQEKNYFAIAIKKIRKK